MSKLAQRIAELHKQRAAKVTDFEALVNKALEEARDLSEDEQKTRSTLKDELEKLDRELDRLEEDEKQLAVRAVPFAAAAPGAHHADTSGSGIVRDDRGRIIRTGIPAVDEFEGAGFTRMAIAVAVAGEFHAAAYAEQRWGSKALGELLREYQFRTKTGEGLLLTRAATPPMNSGEATGSGGGSNLIIIQQLASQFIDMLRPKLVHTRIPGMTNINFGGAGKLVIPKQTGGVTGAYIGEGNSLIVQRLSFDAINLVPSKLGVIVPTTNELLRRSDPSIETMIRNDMLNGTARTITAAFIASVAAPPAPNGILTYNAALAAGAIPAAATVTQVSDALRAMIMAMRNVNEDMISPCWLMHPRQMEYLRLLRTTTTETTPFKDEINGGTLLGYPIIESTLFPVATTAPYVLLDGDDVIWADDMAPIIDASEEATIQSDSAPATPPAAPYVSAFQQDMTLMRIRMSHSWTLRRTSGVVWALSNV